MALVALVACMLRSAYTPSHGMRGRSGAQQLTSLHVLSGHERLQFEEMRNEERMKRIFAAADRQTRAHARGRGRLASVRARSQRAVDSLRRYLPRQRLPPREQWPDGTLQAGAARGRAAPRPPAQAKPAQQIQTKAAPPRSTRTAISAVTTRSGRRRRGSRSARIAHQQLAHWPYQHSSAILHPTEAIDMLGQAIDDSPHAERRLISQSILEEFHNQSPARRLPDNSSSTESQTFSADNPPCYTPEDCSRYVAMQPGSHSRKRSDLPVYDNTAEPAGSPFRQGPDLLAVVSAMQKQDSMIRDQKAEQQRRAAAAAAAAKRGQTVPPLPAVVCGETCWARKGVWCCRSK